MTDGTWAWVDQSPLTLTNWGPGWPQNKDKVWDCGQIFTGSDACRGAVGCGPWAVERGGGGGGGGRVALVLELAWSVTVVFFPRCSPPQGTTRGRGRPPPASRAWPTCVR